MPVCVVNPFSRVGVVPSVVYLKVVPSGIFTLMTIGATNSCPSLSTLGASTLPTANTLLSLLFSGVGIAVCPHELPPFSILAYDVRGTAIG